MLDLLGVGARGGGYTPVLQRGRQLGANDQEPAWRRATARQICLVGGGKPPVLPENGPESVFRPQRQEKVPMTGKRLQRPLQAILVGLSALHEGEQRASCIAGGFPCASTGQMCGDMRIEEIFDFAALFPALDGVD